MPKERPEQCASCKHWLSSPKEFYGTCLIPPAHITPCCGTCDKFDVHEDILEIGLRLYNGGKPHGN